jgi:hypothetical protein
MSFIYELIEIEEGISTIKRTDENGLIAWIPVDPTNSDYQQYLNPAELKADK